MLDVDRPEANSQHLEFSLRFAEYKKLTEFAAALSWVFDNCDLPDSINLSLRQGIDHVRFAIDQRRFQNVSPGEASQYSLFDSQTTYAMKFVDTTLWMSMGGKSTKKDWESLAECHHMWQASPADLIVSSRTLLSTSKLRKLVQYRLLYPCIIIMSLTVALTNFARYSSATRVRVSIPGSSLQFLRPGIWLSSFSLVFGILLMWLLAHTMNRQLLRICLKQFDSLAIILCFIVSSSLQVINRFRFLSPSGRYDVIWIVGDLGHIVLVAAYGIVVGCCDCCMFPPRVLRVFMTFCLLQSFYQWFDNRCVNSQWEDAPKCASSENPMGIVSRDLVSAVYGQITIFVLKSMMSRLRSEGFSSIHAQYFPVDETSKRRPSSRASQSSVCLSIRAESSRPSVPHCPSISASVTNYGHSVATPLHKGRVEDTKVVMTSQSIEAPRNFSL